jgi:hypothetical protein
MTNPKLINLLNEMEKDERLAPAAYQDIINLVLSKSDRAILRASQSDERRHHARIIKLLKKYNK